MPHSLLTDLSRRAEKDASRIFIVDGRKRITFSDAYLHVTAVGSFLRSIGVKRGERVGVLMRKGHLQVLAQMGVMSAGAVMVPITDQLKPEQVQYIVRDCQAGSIIIDDDKIDRLGVEAEAMKILAVGGDNGVTLEQVVEMETIERPRILKGEDNAAIIYSSGSTGFPKGIVLSHNNLWDGARLVSLYLGLTSEDRLAQVLSLNFDYGLNQIFGAVHVGAQVHLTTFHFPKDLFAFLRIHQITTLALMPVFLNHLFNVHYFKPSFAEGITSLDRITTSGGRVSKEIINTIGRVFPNTDLYLMYGLTEAFRSTYLPPDQVKNRPDSIGKPIPEVQIMVLDGEGKECAVDQPGELVHRGGVISKGYWNARDETKKRFRQWADASGNVETAVYSGDIVRRDSEGYLYFIGRRDNMIKTSGHRVSPEEVERVAELINGVDYAVAFGREHPVLGEEIVLVCIRTTEHPPAEVIDIKMFLQQKLAAYMIPQKILFHERLEVTAANQGKVDRTAIRQAMMEKYGER